MSLLRQVQHMLEGGERATGVNLEHFIVGPIRRAQLCRRAGAPALATTAGGGTFLQPGARELRLAIYFPDDVISALEAEDPRRSLSERNISPLITFVEEIAHAVQAGYLYLKGEREFGSEAALRNLEAQAKVDTLLVLHGLAAMLTGTPVPPHVRDWLDDQVFDGSHRRLPPGTLRERYREAETLARDFLHLLRQTPLKKRTSLLSRFRQCDWTEKLGLVAEFQRNFS
ncbi:MAG: hypothetical protein AAGK14_03990 [Verrucomicrobiota bacterium]